MSQGACTSAGAPANAGPIKRSAIFDIVPASPHPFTVRGWPQPWRLPNQGRGHAAPGVLRGGASALKRRTELMMWPWRGSNARGSNQVVPRPGHLPDVRLAPHKTGFPALRHLSVGNQRTAQPVGLDMATKANKTLSEYRERANRVRELAGTVTSTEVRRALLNIAARYDEIANSVAGSARHKRAK